MALELPDTPTNDASVLIPIRPIRIEDRDLIRKWIDARSGVKPEPITDYIIYQHDGNIPPSKHWTNSTTLSDAQQKLTSLARRSPVPLIRVGLTADGTFTQDSLRGPIIAYAKDFEYRSRDRIADMLAKLGPEAARLKGPLIWRTKSWWKFVTYGKEFYNWCERRGLRPRGSNPFTGVSRPTPTSITKTFIVEQWFHRMMNAPMAPKERAIIMLLANGLRANEVLTLKISDLDFEKKNVRVLGKGSKLRNVTLYQRAIIALDHYLTKRHLDTRPWLFPNQRAHIMDHPGHESLPSFIVTRVAQRVFDDPSIVARMTPHKFRHFFISDWLHRGGNPNACKLQVGHCSLAMLERYTHMDPTWVSDEVFRMDPDISQETRDALATALLSRMHPEPAPVQLVDWKPQRIRQPWQYKRESRRETAELDELVDRYLQQPG